MTGSSSLGGRKRGRSPSLCKYHEAVRTALQNQIRDLESTLGELDRTALALQQERDVAVQQKIQIESNTSAVRFNLRWLQEKQMVMYTRWAALKFEVEKMDPDFSVMMYHRAGIPLGAEELEEIMGFP